MSQSDTATAAPVFSVDQGQYVDAQTVSLTSDTDAATIYYRFDFEPPGTSDLEYTGPITVDGTTNMSAVVVKDGQTSEVSYTAHAIRQAGYTNQIANGDFSAGTGAWWTYVNTDAGAQASSTTTDADNDGDDELAVSIENGGSAIYDISSSSFVGFPTHEGDLFELTFTAWVDNAGTTGFRPLPIAVDENGEDVNGNGNSYDAYFWQREFITETARTFTTRIAIYASPNHDHPRTRLVFNLGTDHGVEAG